VFDGFGHSFVGATLPVPGASGDDSKPKFASCAPRTPWPDHRASLHLGGADRPFRFAMHDQLQLDRWWQGTYHLRVSQSAGMQSSPDQNPVFQTTHWSVVLQAAGGESSSAALESLCRAYWYPLYAFVRRQGHDAADAEDLTQGFFELFLAKRYLDDVDRDKGRFRSFLLASLKHFLANEWKKAGRQKRGGLVQTISFDAIAAEERYRHEPAVESPPELAYDCGWARMILKTVLAKLRAEFEQSGRGDRFEVLNGLLFVDPLPGEYVRLASLWKVTESGVRSSVQRIRQRYAALFREEIANTVRDPRDVDGEIAHLLKALGR
jgi:DNA-directed RNA polymerase specialized sigma24 family protein